MARAYTRVSTRKTSQRKALPGRKQVKNNAGGFAFQLNDWQRLDRFLILGTEGGTYYVGEDKLTEDNAEVVRRCIEEDGIRTVERIREISEAGRAVKNEPALFALAMAAGLGDTNTRKMAFYTLPYVARIGTHLFHFVQYAEQFRGWGRAMRDGVANWYHQLDEKGKLAYQLVKYQQRDGWSHRDILRLAKPVPHNEHESGLFAWAVGKDDKPTDQLLYAFEEAKIADEKRVIDLIGEYGLTREMLPTDRLNSKAVWDALLRDMPMTAMIRNLGKMSQVGLLTQGSEAARYIAARVTDDEQLRKARIHPMSVLFALRTYGAGQGFRGSLLWTPVQKVNDALDEAFYKTFGFIEPTGKRTLIALDVSGSMSSWGWGGESNKPVSPAEAAAAMAMVTARTEKDYEVMGFANTFKDLGISPRMNLDTVMTKTSNQNFGGTDAAVPFQWALKNRLAFDTFAVYTDGETWAGEQHVFQALAEYRAKMGIPAKLVVVNMVANHTTLTDPTDPGSLDVVGFDTSTPQVIAEFVRD
jgi:60 kDa SS-A/Ro ribonucleoprotein